MKPPRQEYTVQRGRQAEKIPTCCQQHLSSLSSWKSFMADPVDPPNTYIDFPCTTDTWLSRGIGGIPSVVTADHDLDCTTSIRTHI